MGNFFEDVGDFLFGESGEDPRKKAKAAKKDAARFRGEERAEAAKITELMLTQLSRTDRAAAEQMARFGDASAAALKGVEGAIAGQQGELSQSMVRAGMGGTTVGLAGTSGFRGREALASAALQGQLAEAGSQIQTRTEASRAAALGAVASSKGKELSIKEKWDNEIYNLTATNTPSGMGAQYFGGGLGFFDYANMLTAGVTSVATGVGNAQKAIGAL